MCAPPACSSLCLSANLFDWDLMLLCLQQLSVHNPTALKLSLQFNAESYPAAVPTCFQIVEDSLLQVNKCDTILLSCQTTSCLPCWLVHLQESFSAFLPLQMICMFFLSDQRKEVRNRLERTVIKKRACVKLQNCEKTILWAMWEHVEKLRRLSITDA